MLSLIKFFTILCFTGTLGGHWTFYLSKVGVGWLRYLAGLVTDSGVGSDVFLKLRCLDEAVDSTI
jgi:hypothetical protein